MIAGAFRHPARTRATLTFLLLALGATPLYAQSIVDGQRVEFLPSVDDATLVQGYTLSIYPSGSTTAVSTADLGKPTPDPDGLMRVAYLPLLTAPLQAGVTYEARVSAYGPGGSSPSLVSNTFALTTVCGTSTISLASVNVAAGTGSGSVGVTSACAWSSISNATWITVTGGGSGAGNGTLLYSVAANTATSPRSGTMTIAGNTFTVNQAAAACSYSLSATSQSVAVNGGTGTVTVTAGAGCGWTAVSNATSWLTVTSGATGSGGGSVGFSATANNLTTMRSGTLTIAGATFTVNETACGYTLTPTSQSLTAAGGTGSVTVATGTACPWTAVSNAGWVSVTSGATGTGGGTVGFSAAGNSGTTTRAGTITIGGQTFTVNEAACSFTVSPTSVNTSFSAKTGTLTVTTTAACTWTASSPVSWVTVGSGGTGSGTLTYTLTANGQTTSRTTTLTVAGQSIGVTQGSATPPSAPTNLKIIR